MEDLRVVVQDRGGGPMAWGVHLAGERHCFATQKEPLFAQASLHQGGSQGALQVGDQVLVRRLAGESLAIQLRSLIEFFLLKPHLPQYVQQCGKFR